MTIYTFIDKYYENNPEGHYFDHDTLKFFGNRLSEMRVLKKTEMIKGEECYCISMVERPPFGKPRRKYVYFTVDKFKPII